MIDTEFIKKLKQTNASVDKDKTIERVKAQWKKATNATKQQLLELADISRATIYRIYNTGAISVKTAVPLAMLLDVDPRYLTGQSDQAATCTDESLWNFLLDHGYNKLLAGHDPQSLRKSNRGRKPKTEELQEQAAETKAPAESEVAAPRSSSHLSEEEMVLLLKAVMVRAKAGILSDVEKEKQLRALLLL